MQYSAMAPSRSPLPLERDAEGVMRYGQVQLEANSGPVLGDSLVQVALSLKRGVEVVVRLDEVRLKAKGGAVFGNGSFQITRVSLERVAEAVMRVGSTGSRRSAVRYSAMAPARSPFALSAIPRL